MRCLLTGLARPVGRGAVDGSGGTWECRVTQAGPGKMPSSAPRRSRGVLHGIAWERPMARAGDNGTKRASIAASPHSSQPGFVGRGSAAPCAVVRQPSAGALRAGDGRNREGLVDDEPGARGRGIDREKAGKEGRPIELDGHRRGIARGQRSYGCAATGGAVAGATPGGLDRNGRGSVPRIHWAPRICFCGLRRHVMADEPIAAARLGRL